MAFRLVGRDIIFIDELLTSDLSRFWPQAIYRPGGPQESYDKQYVRDHLLSLDWDMCLPGPKLPPEVIENTRLKYLEALKQLSGDTHGL